MNSSPRQISSVGEMQRFSLDARSKGHKISFVPTMGALHEGHLSLVRTASERADLVVVSIFVNPIQFAEGEDYDKYTRDIEGDIQKLSDLNVDVVFTPELNDILPPGHKSYVEVTGLQDCLCGVFRPGHFRGVATIVLKLFNIIVPDNAVFGEKDYQQLKIIQKMVNDLNLDIGIIPAPIVREDSGLALSSRNCYLTGEQHKRAGSISTALGRIKKIFEDGTTDVEKLVEIGVKILKEKGIDDIDYLEIRDGNSLEEINSASRGNIVAVAVRLGNTRLIDNIKL